MTNHNEAIRITMIDVYHHAASSAHLAECNGTPLAEYKDTMERHYKEARAYRNRVSENDNSSLLTYARACAEVLAWEEVCNHIKGLESFDACRKHCSWLIDKLAVDPA